MPPIAMLHHVSDDVALNGLGRWCVSHEKYLQLLNFIEENDYRTVTFEDLVEGGYSRSKSVILTFDDCPKELLSFAVPELLRRNMKAVFYMPTAYIGGYNEWDVQEARPKTDLMSEDDIRGLVASGMEIGSHAHKHIELEYETEDDAYRALYTSKKILEEIIDKKILTVAYPYGSVPKNHINIAKRLGFVYGLSVYNPIVSKYSIRRWIFDNDDTAATMREKMSVFYSMQRWWYDKWFVWSKQVPRYMYRKYSGLKSIARKK
ncbi:MAG: polysaccharide deacetylase family protein [Chitinophagaceae bacterium]|nr:polysaccharide deacetylase family protein [Chitinophagaceae bacterium]